MRTLLSFTIGALVGTFCLKSYYFQRKFMPLTPSFDRVSILPEQAPEESPGGIVLPDGARPDPLRGKVVGVGRNVEIAPGSIVYYPESQGHLIEHEGETYLILKADEILAVVS